MIGGNEEQPADLSFAKTDFTTSILSTDTDKDTADVKKEKMHSLESTIRAFYGSLDQLYSRHDFSVNFIKELKVQQQARLCMEALLQFMPSLSTSLAD